MDLIRASAKGVVGEAILCGHRGYLAGQIVTAGVQAGSSFTDFGFRPARKLGVCAIGSSNRPKGDEINDDYNAHIRCLGSSCKDSS